MRLKAGSGARHGSISVQEGEAAPQQIGERRRRPPAAQHKRGLPRTIGARKAFDRGAGKVEPDGPVRRVVHYYASHGAKEGHLSCPSGGNEGLIYVGQWRLRQVDGNLQPPVRHAGDDAQGYLRGLRSFRRQVGVGHEGSSPCGLLFSFGLALGTRNCLVDLMQRMTEGKFRHFPVIEERQLIGIVSIGDVVKSRLKELERESNALNEYRPNHQD